jgi:hypothetical protein
MNNCVKKDSMKLLSKKEAHDFIEDLLGATEGRFTFHRESLTIEKPKGE